MRRFLLFVPAVAILFLAAVTFNPLTAPSLENAEPAMALNPEGTTAFLAENREYRSFIYSVEENGRAGVVYHEPARAGKTRTVITDLAGLDGGLLFVRASGDAASATLRSWELVYYDMESREAGTLYARADGRAPASVRAAVFDGQIYIVLRTLSGETAEIYELDPSAKRPELRLVGAAEAPEGTKILSAVYARRLYCQLSDGRIVTFAGNSSAYGVEFSGGTAQALGLNGQNLFFQDVAGRSVYYGVDGSTFRADLPETADRVVAGCARTKDRGFAALVRDAEGGTGLVTFDGGEFSNPVTVRFSPAERLGVAAAQWNTPGGAAALLAFASLLLAGYCLLGSRFFTRLSALTACFVLLLSGAAVAISLHTSYQAAYELRLEQVKNVVDSLDLSGASGDGAAGWSLPLRPAGTPDSVDIRCDFFTVEGDAASTASSYRLPNGLTPEQSYGAETAADFRQVMETNVPLSGTALSGGYRQLVWITPAQVEKIPAGMLVVTASVNDLAFTRHELYESLALRCALLAAAALAVIMLLIRLFMRPLRILPRQMHEIAAGRLTFGDITYRRGEIGDIQRSMQEMCLSLARRAHETEAVLKSYYRFVPQGFERLLGKSSVLEIESGAAVSLRCNVGILLVANGDAVGAEAGGGALMRFVSQTFSSVYGAAKENRGMFVSGDFNLSGFQLMFPDDAGDGMRFGLRLFSGELADAPFAGGEKPAFSLLLHSANSLYSIVGNDEKVFPFISSYELSLLGRLAPRLASICTGLFVTDQYLREAGEGFNHRYIGFISAGDERHTFKIYEVLDVLPVSEKLLRQQYDHQFQEAIRLYYKNDFYLARSTFSSLYKLCPGDVIARHYIFACERQFNQEDLETIDYSLFGA